MLEPEETEITPEMIEAGISALAASDRRFMSSQEIVERVFHEMYRASSVLGKLS